MARKYSKYGKKRYTGYRKKRTYKKRSYGAKSYGRRKTYSKNTLVQDKGFYYSIRRKIYKKYSYFAKLVWKQAHPTDSDTRWDKSKYKKHKKAFILSAIKCDLYGKLYASQNIKQAKDIAKLMKGAQAASKNSDNHPDGDPSTPAKRARHDMEQTVENVANTDVADAVSAQTGIPKGDVEGAERAVEGFARHIHFSL